METKKTPCGNPRAQRRRPERTEAQDDRQKSSLPTLREVCAECGIDPDQVPELVAEPSLCDKPIIAVHVCRWGVDYETCVGVFGYDWKTPYGMDD
jgi:hypothetical protein